MKSELENHFVKRFSQKLDKKTFAHISNDNEFTGGRFKLKVATLPLTAVSTNPLEVESKRVAFMREAA